MYDSYTNLYIIFIRTNYRSLYFVCQMVFSPHKDAGFYKRL